MVNTKYYATTKLLYKKPYFQSYVLKRITTDFLEFLLFVCICHQIVFRLSFYALLSERHQTVIRATSERHQSIIRASSERHQNVISPLGRHQSIIRASPKRHQSIRLSSDIIFISKCYQTSIKQSSDCLKHSGTFVLFNRK